MRPAGLEEVAFPLLLRAILNILEYAKKVNQSTRGGTRIATVAVTGGTGFVGSHAVEKLLNDGLNVRCLVRPGRAGLGWLTHLPVEHLPVNLFDINALTTALRNADAVVHIAGVSRGKGRKDFFHGNVESTRCLLEAAVRVTNVKKFCFISSLTAAGPSPDGSPINEETPPHPLTPYGASKLEAENVVRRFRDSISTVILRPPAVYGPRDKDILHMFRWIKFGFMPVMGQANKTLSLIYATDLARAIAAVLASDRSAGKTYFVGDSESYRYADLVSYCASLLEGKTRNIPIPTFLMYSIAAATQAVSWFLPQPSVVNIDKVKDLLSPYWVCSPALIERELGFRTAVEAHEGLRLTLDWYRRQGWL